MEVSFTLSFKSRVYNMPLSITCYARLAQSVEHQTFNLRVAGSSPSSGGNIFFKTSFLYAETNHSRTKFTQVLLVFAVAEIVS